MHAPGTHILVCYFLELLEVTALVPKLAILEAQAAVSIRPRDARILFKRHKAALAAILFHIMSIPKRPY